MAVVLEEDYKIPGAGIREEIWRQDRCTLIGSGGGMSGRVHDSDMTEKNARVRQQRANVLRTLHTFRKTTIEQTRLQERVFRNYELVL